MPPTPYRRTPLQQLAAGALSLLLIAWLPVSVVTPALASPVPGGPGTIGGPGFGIDGVPFTWNSTSPIQYRVDPGPMSVNTSGTTIIDNATGINRVNAMFATWSAVQTASLSFANAGGLLSSGAYSGGPVAAGNALSNYNALTAACSNGSQSPVIFDPNGSLFTQLGLSSTIIGFAGPCSSDSSGHIKSAKVVLNGKFQDGSSANLELTTNQFNQAITHEIGHLLGLDHSQLNVSVLAQQSGNCNISDLVLLPIMFPILQCQDRVTAGLPPLSYDDQAWISRLYPVTAPAAGKTLTSSSYGTISGTVFFSDGVTQVQGVNVIARLTANPQAVAFSAVSGYLFTESLGQSVTCGVSGSSCNTAGASSGTRDTRFVGAFDIPAVPGTYTIRVEPINPLFTGGSSVGPLSSPIPMPGTAPTTPPQVTVVAGGTATTNITLQGTASRFDAFESSDLFIYDSLQPWLRRDQSLDGACA